MAKADRAGRTAAAEKVAVNGAAAGAGETIVLPGVDCGAGADAGPVTLTPKQTPEVKWPDFLELIGASQINSIDPKTATEITRGLISICEVLAHNLLDQGKRKDADAVDTSGVNGSDLSLIPHLYFSEPQTTRLWEIWRESAKKKGNTNSLLQDIFQTLGDNPSLIRAITNADLELLLSKKFKNSQNALIGAVAESQLLLNDANAERLIPFALKFQLSYIATRLPSSRYFFETEAGRAKWLEFSKELDSLTNERLLSPSEAGTPRKTKSFGGLLGDYNKIKIIVNRGLALFGEARFYQLASALLLPELDGVINQAEESIGKLKTNTKPERDRKATKGKKKKLASKEAWETEAVQIIGKVDPEPKMNYVIACLFDLSIEPDLKVIAEWAERWSTPEPSPVETDDAGRICYTLSTGPWAKIHWVSILGAKPSTGVVNRDNVTHLVRLGAQKSYGDSHFMRGVAENPALLQILGAADRVLLSSLIETAKRAGEGSSLFLRTFKVCFDNGDFYKDQAALLNQVSTFSNSSNIEALESSEISKNIEWLFQQNSFPGRLNFTWRTAPQNIAPEFIRAREQFNSDISTEVATDGGRKSLIDYYKLKTVEINTAPRLGRALELLLKVVTSEQPAYKLVPYYLAQNTGLASSNNLVLYLARFAKQNPTHPAALGLLANQSFVTALKQLPVKDRLHLLGEEGETIDLAPPPTRPEWLPDTHRAPESFLLALAELSRTTNKNNRPASPTPPTQPSPLS